MAGARGAYFKATNALAFDQEAQRIRARYGSTGFDWYVSVMCVLINQSDGTLDVSDDEGWEYLAMTLHDTSAEEIREFCAYLARRGLLDADLLGSGVLSSPLVRAGIEEYDRFSRAGRAPGAARKRKAEKADEQRSNDVRNDV